MFIAANFPYSVLNIELLPYDVMHGEGNLLAHLVIIGYKIPYQQVIFSEVNARSYIRSRLLMYNVLLNSIIGVALAVSLS